jgi:hypothetical protein
MGARAESLRHSWCASLTVAKQPPVGAARCVMPMRLKSKLPVAPFNWRTIYTRMNRRSKSGVLDRVFEKLQQA